jgi:hypothetical protein
MSSANSFPHTSKSAGSAMCQSGSNLMWSPMLFLMSVSMDMVAMIELSRGNDERESQEMLALRPATAAPCIAFTLRTAPYTRQKC